MIPKFLLSNAMLAIVLTLTGCADEGSINGKSLSTAGSPPPTLSTAANPPLKILVLGGTSGIGLELVKLALERGHLVTATSRHPENLTLTHDNLANVEGDVMNAGRMAELVAGKNIIVSAIGIGPTRDPVSVYSRGIENVLAAIPARYNTKLITITGIGAGDSRGHGSFFYDNIFWPLALKTAYEDKDRQEQLLKQSETNWTIVRPGFLIDEPASLRYRIVEHMEGVTSGKISRADVAHFIMAASEQNLYEKATVFLSN